MTTQPAAIPTLPRLTTLDNLRDVAGTGAGYPTGNGRVRRGVLYRSNRIEVSPEDLVVLESLGLTAIHDLREEHEIVSHPDTSVAGAPWYHHPVPGIPQEEVAALSDADQTYAAMIENYRTFVSDPQCRRGFADLLSGIASIEGPQLFHCSAGKDRTGWATVLIHYIAGVDPQAMTADYLLTDEYAVNSRKATLDSILENVGAARAPAYEPAFRCDTTYLDTAFAEVERLYGDMDGYLEDGLGLTESERQILRTRLVCEL